jgi:hypothetical protein
LGFVRIAEQKKYSGVIDALFKEGIVDEDMSAMYKSKISRMYEGTSLYYILENPDAVMALVKKGGVEFSNLENLNLSSLQHILKNPNAAVALLTRVGGGVKFDDFGNVKDSDVLRNILENSDVVISLMDKGKKFEQFHNFLKADSMPHAQKILNDREEPSTKCVIS